MKVFMNTKNIHIILVLMTLAMFGCSDKKDSSSSCLNQLNEEKYQQVAENSNCSNYHRGSAYLGMAGMSFSNFLKKGAADFLTRPIQSRELIRSLDRLVNLKRGFITAPMVNETTPNPENDELGLSQGGWRKELIEESKTLEIDNNFENLYPLVNFLTEDLSGYQILEDEELIPLKTLLTEALENAIFHGNLELPSELRLENSELFFETAKQKSCLEPYQNRRVVIQYNISRNSVKYIIRDEGKGFEHSEIPDPIDPQNLFQLQGRGILRIALFMDEMFWNEKGNEITMIRYKKRKSSS